MALSDIYNSEQGVLTGAGDWNPNNNNVGDTALQFNSGTTGDLILEANGGGVDPDTTVSVNGGGFVNFTFVETGTIGEGNFAGEEYTIIEIAGKKYILFNDLPDASGGYGGSGTILVLVAAGDPDSNACFTRGTMIDTPDGAVAIETLSVGDEVSTKQNGAREIMWIASTTVKLREGQEPILIKAGALGNAKPTTDLLVSPQHRIWVSDASLELLFGTKEALVAAKHLVNGVDIIEMADLREIEYFHFLCDQHQVVQSNGAYTESLHPGQIAINAWDRAARDEILTIFPELKDGVESYGPTAIQSLRGFEARAMQSFTANHPS